MFLEFYRFLRWLGLQLESRSDRETNWPSKSNFEPAHLKKVVITMANSKGSSQPVHPQFHSLSTVSMRIHTVSLHIQTVSPRIHIVSPRIHSLAARPHSLARTFTVHTFSSGTDKEGIKNNFLQFSIKTYVVGTH